MTTGYKTSNRHHGTLDAGKTFLTLLSLVMMTCVSLHIASFYLSLPTTGDWLTILTL